MPYSSSLYSIWNAVLATEVCGLFAGQPIQTKFGIGSFVSSVLPYTKFSDYRLSVNVFHVNGGQKNVVSYWQYWWPLQLWMPA